MARRRTAPEGEGGATSRRPARRTAPLVEARRIFGGLDVPASLAGMLTALSLLILIAGIVGAALGAIGYQKGLKGNVEKLSLAGLVGGAVALFLAYLIGGWVAGRMARYDGMRNGLMTGIWTIVLAAILAALGAWLGTKYNVFKNVKLPHWFSHNAWTWGGIISGLVTVAAMLLGGALGGIWGESYHRRADAAILGAERRRVRQAT